MKYFVLNNCVPDMTLFDPTILSIALLILDKKIIKYNYFAFIRFVGLFFLQNSEEKSHRQRVKCNIYFLIEIEHSMW